MKVFLAGGSGAIGRRLIPQLVAAGHQVAATTRTAAKGPIIQSLGAIPVVVDALDGPALSKAVTDFRPDAAMNQLTDLPQRYNPRKLGPFYERTRRRLCAPARRRMLPIVGSGGGVFSFLHVDDAAGAAVAGLEDGQGVYNIVDDDPAAARDWIPAFCRDIGAPAPMQVPGWLVELMAGSFAAATMQRGRGASNAKAKRELGWTLLHSTWRDGFVTRP